MASSFRINRPRVDQLEDLVAPQLTLDQILDVLTHPEVERQVGVNLSTHEPTDLARIWDSFSPQHQILLYRAYTRDKNAWRGSKDIAFEIGMSPNSTRNIRRTALNNIREALEHGPDDWRLLHSDIHGILVRHNLRRIEQLTGDELVELLNDYRFGPMCIRALDLLLARREERPLYARLNPDARSQFQKKFARAYPHQIFGEE